MVLISRTEGRDPGNVGMVRLDVLTTDPVIRREIEALLAGSDSGPGGIRGGARPEICKRMAIGFEIGPQNIGLTLNKARAAVASRVRMRSADARGRAKADMQRRRFGV